MKWAAIRSPKPAKKRKGSDQDPSQDLAGLERLIRVSYCQEQNLKVSSKFDSLSKIRTTKHRLKAIDGHGRMLGG